MSYAPVANRLAAGKVVLLDGAIGTELQRRGVAMEPTAWCGAAGPESTAVLTGVHRDYIDAGADVITANTFATSRVVLDAAGLSDRYDQINRTALQAAHAAAQGRVAVAGSISNMTPRRDLHGAPDLAALADAQAELAQTLKDGGCDLIVLEMMFAPERLEGAFRAAAATGLPVWAGFSARRGADGRLLSFAQDREIPFQDLLGILADHPVAAAGVMHSESDVVGEALSMIRTVHDGPLTAYPDSGYMKMPDWQFHDIIPVADLRAFAGGWVDQGVQVLGGCCGLGPAHIAGLRDLRG